MKKRAKLLLIAIVPALYFNDPSLGFNIVEAAPLARSCTAQQSVAP